MWLFRIAASRQPWRLASINSCRPDNNVRPYGSLLDPKLLDWPLFSDIYRFKRLSPPARALKLTISSLFMLSACTNLCVWSLDVFLKELYQG